MATFVRVATRQPRGRSLSRGILGGDSFGGSSPDAMRGLEEPGQYLLREHHERRMTERREHKVVEVHRFL